MRKQFKDIDIYAGIKAQDGLKTIILRLTGRPQSTLRFAQFIQRKTLKVWSTSILQLVFLLICVVLTL